MSNKNIYTAVLAIILLGLVFYSFFIWERDAQEIYNGKIKIAATIFPLYDIAKNIAGDRADVVLIVPPGASPHIYELTPQKAKELQDVTAVFAIGHGLDDWAAGLDGIYKKEVKITVLSNGIQLKELEGSIDPHYWLTVPNAKIILQNILEKLKEIDPENSAYYENKANEYLNKLDETDMEMRQIFESVAKKEMITMHDAWFYFGEEYGFNIVAAFEPFPGKEPTARYLKELSETAEEYEISVIYSEPQLSNEVLIPFLKDYNLNLAVLDPIGGASNRESYIDLMLFNARTISEQSN